MKNFYVIATICALNLFSSSISKATSPGTPPPTVTAGLVPVVSSETAIPSTKVGQIFFDTSVSAFKGVNNNGKYDMLTNQPAPVVPADPSLVVSSDPTGRRIASATFDVDTANGQVSVSSQDGNWVSKVETLDGGQILIYLTAGAFSKAPVCTCTVHDASDTFCKLESSPTLANIKINQMNVTKSTLSVPFSLICIGAK